MTRWLCIGEKEIGTMLHSIMGFMRTERAQRHQFERVVQDAEDHTRIVMTGGDVRCQTE